MKPGSSRHCHRSRAVEWGMLPMLQHAREGTCLCRSSFFPGRAGQAQAARPLQHHGTLSSTTGMPASTQSPQTTQQS